MEIDLDSDIIVTNKGGIPRTDQFPNQQLDLKQQLAHHMLTVGSHESPVTSELTKRLEQNTIPYSEIDLNIIAIKENIVQYFKEQAKSEGLIGNENSFDLKIVFVKPEFFGEEKETKGNFFPLERIIVVSYLGIIDEIELFMLATTMFHESRHAVSKQAGVIHLSSDAETHAPGELPYDEVSILVGMDRVSMSSEFDLLEEVYAEGYTAEFLAKIENTELKKCIEWCEKRAKEQGLNKLLITSFKKKSYGKLGFEESGYTDVLRIFFSLKENIPNILDLFADIRSGKKGSRQKLAQAIISNYDKDVLNALVRGMVDEASWKKLLIHKRK